MIVGCTNDSLFKYDLWSH